VSADRARIEALLEGHPLPASRDDLISYVENEDARAAELLRRIPDRAYRSLDEVGEALAPAQPPHEQQDAGIPRPESGLPPGGEDYVNPSPTPGQIRPDGPSSARAGE
jgi:Protein of unknown function (DUF2795)